VKDPAGDARPTSCAARWPPRVGDRLRRYTLREDGGQVRQVHAPIRVVAAFHHDGDAVAVGAERTPGGRWSYAIILRREARLGEYWPDGQPPPAEHRPCDACAGERIDRPTEKKVR
jgi:hypothetical protein